MSRVDEMLALIDRQMADRRERVTRRERKADKVALKAGARHPANDNRAAHERDLLEDLRQIRRYLTEEG